MGASTRAVPLPLMVAPLTSSSAASAAEISERALALLPPAPVDEPVAPAEHLLPQRIGPPGTRAYPQNVADRPVPRLGAQPWLISEEWEKRHERQCKAFKRDEAKVVFLGDSITDAWRMSPSYREHFGKYSPLNLGIHGEYTQNLLWRIEHGALDGLTPAAVVVMIGINNLAGGFSPPETASGVRAVVTAVRKRLSGTPVLLLSILPAQESPESPLRRKIIETNRLISGLAAPGVTVQDVGFVLLEPDGRITKAILRDFLHPTDTGYQRLSGAVAPLLGRIIPQG